MKILLDEIVNKKIKKFLSEFQVFTVREMNWLGKTNGDLISQAVEDKFETIISNDTNLKFQQNLKKFDIYFIVIKTIDNNIESILPLIPS
ncbi:MAG: hypothetical protein ABI462_01975 [Ignavibacteria bacterium]